MRSFKIQQARGFSWLLEAQYWRSLFGMLLDKENERIGVRPPVLLLGVRRERLMTGLRRPCD